MVVMLLLCFCLMCCSVPAFRTLRPVNSSCPISLAPPSGCYPSPVCEVTGRCGYGGRSSAHMLCDPTFERCDSHTDSCNVTLPLQQANVCLASVIGGSIDPNGRTATFGCRIGGACQPFNQERSSSEPCMQSSVPDALHAQRCTGDWVPLKGQLACDCAGSKFMPNVAAGGTTRTYACASSNS